MILDEGLGTFLIGVGVAIAVGLGAKVGKGVAVGEGDGLESNTLICWVLAKMMPVTNKSERVTPLMTNIFF